MLEHAQKVQSIQQGTVQADVWALTYHLPWPLKRRLFLELVTTVQLPSHFEPLSPAHLEQAKSWLEEGTAPLSNSDGFRSFLVISVPASVPGRPSNEENKVHGRYASVEMVVESAERIEWTMVTQSDAGGIVKPWLANSSMPKTLAADVPAFCNWVRSKVAS